MTHSRYTSFLGYLIILSGFVLLILVAGELIVRFLLALSALMIINYGMRLTGGGSMQSMAMRACFSRIR